MTGQTHTQMSQEDKERIAQEKYGMSYEELDTNQKKAVGGSYGGPKGGETVKKMFKGEGEGTGNE
ncbi:hypothetical protein GPECTOR_10g1066 [Gonium pectorale]|uniref:Uncharacterized protein n=1 Tax=Gonium pectorale TaxID=33097 RepID=A0A150GQI5_GONPE|nr:hypothetical protein GPECTOR_10g1066 [Gonium pectorale]|eukprot:KXZ52043.1 hypothetical protein GPECTOR_10g1066 [Gonium pectorale]